MTRKQDAAGWYAVRSLHRADHGGRGANSKTLLEERFLLIWSAPRSARAAARKEAKKREHSYRNKEDELVRWKLQQVVSVFAISDQIKHGKEIYSRDHLNSKPTSTIKRLGFRPGQTFFR